jgi:hypothetical protein
LGVALWWYLISEKKIRMEKEKRWEGIREGGKEVSLKRRTQNHGQRNIEPLALPVSLSIRKK